MQFVLAVVAFYIAWQLIPVVAAVIAVPVVGAVLGVFSVLCDQVGLLWGFGLTMGVVVPAVMLGFITLLAKVA